MLSSVLEFALWRTPVSCVPGCSQVLLRDGVPIGLGHVRRGTGVPALAKKLLCTLCTLFCRGFGFTTC